MTAAAPRMTIDEEHPWPGLGAFDEAAERFFNGRSNEIAELRRLVLNAPLTILFGGSGLGKSSLIQAGLFPALRKERILPVYIRMDVTDQTMPLIDQVERAFEAQMRAWNVDAPPFGADEDLWHYLHRADLELWSAQNQLLTPLFAFDQFEEVFTLGAANQTAIKQFQTDLADLVENRMPAAMAQRIEQSESATTALAFDRQRYKVLLSFRSDFLPAVERWKRKIPSIMRNRFQLLPMSSEHAFQAVHDTAPAIAGEEIARKIVSFVAATQEKEIGRTAEAMEEGDDVFVEPALLSLVCHGLNERRREMGKPAFDQELLDRSASSIIATYYSDSVHDMPDEVQQFIENELITERGFRKPCDIDDARSVHHVTDEQLQTLVARRLLRIDPQHNTQRVELTHDLLTRVVRDHRDRRRELDRRKEEDEKSQARARVQRRRAIVLGGTLLILAAVAVWMAIMYRRAREQADLATAGRLAALALFAKNSRLDLGALLSVEAQRHAGIFETRNAAVATWQANPRLITYLHHSAAIQGVAISPDGVLLASAGADGAVCFWDVATHRPLGNPLKFHKDGVNSVRFSPDGKLLASASDDRTIRLWDVASRKPVGDPLAGHTDEVNAVAFSPDGTLLASGSTDKTVRLWDVRSRNTLGPVLQAQDVVWAVAFSPDGKLLAAGGDDTIIRFVDVRTRQPKGPEIHTGNSVYDLAFSPDGRLLASGQGDATVRLWKTGDRAADGEPLRGHSNYTFSVAFSPDGKMLASGSYDHTVRLWDVAEHKMIGAPFEGHGSYVYGVAFSPKDKILASSGFDQQVLLWDISGHDSMDRRLAGHLGNVAQVAFTPDSRRLISAGGDQTVRFWDTASWEAAGDPIRGTLAFDHVAVSPDGKMIATATSGGLQVWDASNQNRIATVSSSGKSAVTSVAWSRTDTIAWTSEDGAIHEYDIANRREPLRPFKDGTAASIAVAYSPDGALLASAGGDRMVRLWEPSTGRVLSVLKGHEAMVQAVAFSPDGRLLASAGYDQAVRIWEVATRSAVGGPLRHGAPVDAVAFSPDSKLLAAGSDDQTVRLWDVDAQLPLGDPFAGHTGPVRGVAFSPDGKWLASGGDQTVRVWPVTLEAWADRSCRLANRNLSWAEWRQYVGPGMPYRRTCPALPQGLGAPRD